MQTTAKVNCKLLSQYWSVSVWIPILVFAPINFMLYSPSEFSCFKEPAHKLYCCFNLYHHLTKLSFHISQTLLWNWTCYSMLPQLPHQLLLSQQYQLWSQPTITLIYNSFTKKKNIQQTEIQKLWKTVLLGESTAFSKYGNVLKVRCKSKYSEELQHNSTHILPMLPVSFGHKDCVILTSLHQFFKQAWPFWTK